MGVGINKSVIFCNLNTIVEDIKTTSFMSFRPNVFNTLKALRDNTDYSFVLYGAVDKVGTPEFSRPFYDEVESYILNTLKAQGFVFEKVIISFTPEFDVKLLAEYILAPYDKGNSYVISDKPLGLWSFLPFTSWKQIEEVFLPNNLKERTAEIKRETKETKIELSLNLDGNGSGHIHTDIGFFDHMLDQLVKHSYCDIHSHVVGDLFVDEHHTVEDLAITLGQAFDKALGDKRGIKRYGSDMLIMDDVVATVCLDFSGRPEFIFDCEFKRNEVGGFPTEMFAHFFKSFSNAAKCNLYMSVTAGNTHHQVEALFKAFARSIKMAIKRIPGCDALPSTKGVL